jgi:hypothetical protein
VGRRTLRLVLFLLLQFSFDFLNYARARQLRNQHQINRKVLHAKKRRSG